MVRLLNRVCKNCGSYDVCIWANPHRIENCDHWQPGITYCHECQYLRSCRACCRCANPKGLKEPDPTLNTFCAYGNKMEASNEDKAN